MMTAAIPYYVIYMLTARLARENLEKHEDMVCAIFTVWLQRTVCEGFSVCLSVCLSNACIV